MTDTTDSKTKDNETFAPTHQSCMLIINYLPESWDEVRFNKELQPFKAVNTHLVMNSEGKTRCFGFAKFLSPADAEYAYTQLTGRLVEEGKRLKVTPAKPQDEIRKNTNVYIAGLPPTPFTTPELLRDLVLPHGTVLESRLLHDSISKSLQETLSAFVRFARRSESDAAIEALNGAIISPPGTKKKWVINARYALDSRTRRNMFRSGNDSNKQVIGASDSRGSSTIDKGEIGSNFIRTQNDNSADASNIALSSESYLSTSDADVNNTAKSTAVGASAPGGGSTKIVSNKIESVASERVNLPSGPSSETTTVIANEAILTTNNNTKTLSHYPEPSILSILKAASTAVIEEAKSNNNKKSPNEGGSNRNRGNQRPQGKNSGSNSNSKGSTTPSPTNASAQPHHGPYGPYPPGQGPVGDVYANPHMYPPPYDPHPYSPRHGPYPPAYGGFSPSPKYAGPYHGPGGNPYFDRMYRPDPYLHAPPYPSKGPPPGPFTPPPNGVRGPPHPPYVPGPFPGDVEWPPFPVHYPAYPPRYAGEPLYPPPGSYERGPAPPGPRNGPNFPYEGPGHMEGPEDSSFSKNRPVASGTVSRMKQDLSSVAPPNYGRNNDRKLYNLPNSPFMDSSIDTAVTDSNLLFPPSHSNEHDKFGHGSVGMDSPDSRYSTHTAPSIGTRAHSEARESVIAIDTHTSAPLSFRTSSHTSLDKEPSLWKSIQYRDKGFLYNPGSYGEKHSIPDNSFAPNNSSTTSSRWSLDSEERRQFPSSQNSRAVSETGNYPSYFTD